MSDNPRRQGMDSRQGAVHTKKPANPYEMPMMDIVGTEVPAPEPTRQERVVSKMAPPAPAPQAPAPAPVREPAAESSGANWWEALMVGATPALAGYLAGDAATGFSHGGKGLNTLYENEIEANKAKAESLRSKSEFERGRHTLKAVETPDGVTNWRAYDHQTQEWADPSDDVLAGYKQTIRPDPISGELKRFSGAGNIGDIQGRTGPQAPHTVKQEGDLKAYRAGLLADKKYAVARSTQTSANRALALLQSNNPISDEGIKTIFPRMFGEVGNLAAAEQDRFGGSQAMMARWERIKQKAKTGNLPSSDRRYLREVALVMSEYANRNAAEVAKSHATSFRNQYGYDPSAISDPFLAEGQPEAKSVVREARKSLPPKETLVEFKGEKYYVETGKEKEFLRYMEKGKK